MIIFFETSMEVKTKRYLDNVCCIRTFGDYCVIIFRTDEIGGAVSYIFNILIFLYFSIQCKYVMELEHQWIVNLQI